MIYEIDENDRRFSNRDPYSATNYFSDDEDEAADFRNIDQTGGRDLNDYVIVRDVHSEIAMIQQYAAESIQDAFRRYKDCKPAVQLKKRSKDVKLVQDLAADTIKNGMRRYVLLL